MENQKCTCKWCAIRSPLRDKIKNLLTDEQDKINFDNLLGDLIVAETDVIYWKDKYDGTWSGDTVEDIQHHIEKLQARIKELQNENQ
jgi:hypothetical protein